MAQFSDYDNELKTFMLVDRNKHYQKILRITTPMHYLLTGVIPVGSFKETVVICYIIQAFTFLKYNTV
jgi:hypothetical protein